MRFHVPTILATLILTLAACGDTPAAEPRELKIEHVQVFEPAGGQDTALGALSITAGDEDLRLIGASTDAAQSVEIHITSRGENGRSQMRRADGVDIPAGQTVRFGHGGPHLMLFGFNDTLAPGDVADLILTLEQPDGAPLELTVPVNIVDLDAPGS